MAFATLEVCAVGALFAGADRVIAVTDAANAGDVAAILTFVIPFLSAGIALFYLLIGAALALVDAEYGGAGRFGRKLGTGLQFFYLMFGVFFVHRRIRRLVNDFDSGDPIVVKLPLGSLKIEQQACGHLSLLLTERIGWDDFECYATELLRRLDGRVVWKGSAADMHIWNVEIETLPFRLVYDDYPNGVTLESESYPGDMLLQKLQARLAPASGTQAESLVSESAS
jgi:hypothetical protein